MQSFTRIFYSLAIVFFAPLVLSAQSLADSLAGVLATAPQDTHRVSLLYDLAWDIAFEHPDEAEARLREAVSLAQKFGYRAGEANAWNGLGTVEEVRDNFRKAIEYYKKALDLRQALGDERGVAKANSNIGKAYQNLGDFDRALEFQRENLRICQQLKDAAGAARAHSNIAVALEEMGIYPEAYGHLNEYRQYMEEQGDTTGMARAYTLMGHIRFEMDLFGEARRWYERALNTREQLGDSTDIADALVDLANVLDELDTTRTEMAIPYYMRALDIRKVMNDQSGMAAIYNNLGDALKHLKQFEKGMFYLRESLRIRKEMNDQPGLMETYNTIGDVLYGQQQYRESLRYVERYFGIADTIGDQKYRQRGYKDFAKIYGVLGEYKKAYEYRVLYDELRYKLLDENQTRDFEHKEIVFNESRRQQLMDQQKHDIEIRDTQISRSRIIGFALIGGAIALALLAALLYNRSRLRARVNRELASQNEVIKRERERADSLLANILPAMTAEELKQYGTVKPVRYESVTVLFTDFKGFTTIAELVTPEALITELDECFRMFDAVMEQFGLEKIKTIGDSYMCAGGLPTPNNTHATDMVSAAIEMQRRLGALMVHKQAEGKPVFEMRVGIHTGPVVAGIVGSHKFAYDIWGDTVNIAARLEQGGEPAKINISETTYQLVRHQFECAYRGKLAAKNKGEIAMYFVEY